VWGREPQLRSMKAARSGRTMASQGCLRGSYHSCLRKIPVMTMCGE
jgi:hypothetical protein